jgi:circadian clock protein KaiC
VPGLDEICGGGMLQSSTVLAVGSTGTGKSLLTAHFLAAEGAGPALLIGTEESREQIFRNSRAWGIDLEGLERSGALRIVCAYPESGTLEDHLIGLKDELETLHPARLAIDSLTAFERVASAAAYREFVVALTAFVKRSRVCSLLTSTTAIRLGRGVTEDAAISTAMDSIVILRYIDEKGSSARGLMVLKMRGSNHSKQMHRIEISDAGMRVGAPFQGINDILGEDPHIRE